MQFSLSDSVTLVISQLRENGREKKLVFIRVIRG